MASLVVKNVNIYVMRKIYVKVLKKSTLMNGRSLSALKLVPSQPFLIFFDDRIDDNVTFLFIKMNV